MGERNERAGIGRKKTVTCRGGTPVGPQTCVKEIGCAYLLVDCWHFHASGDNNSAVRFTRRSRA
jgi:hypothetical protein